MDDPETANNIMLTFISMPYMLVLDPLTHLFYVPEENIEQMNVSSVGKFLKTVKADKVQVSEKHILKPFFIAASPLLRHLHIT